MFSLETVAFIACMNICIMVLHHRCTLKHFGDSKIRFHPDIVQEPHALDDLCDSVFTDLEKNFTSSGKWQFEKICA